MAIWQGKSNRKPTGGRRVPSANKRKFEIGIEKQFTKLGAESLKQYRGAGGNVKVGMLVAEYANVVDKNSGKVTKMKIVNVSANPADPNYIQRNILNKGATIDLEDGSKAVVTSRPGQDGSVNAILLA